MKVSNHKKFACFDYESKTSERFQLGDIVINEDKEVGVIIQIHDNDEFRTDMFGNCHFLEIKKATKKEVVSYRSGLVEEIKPKKLYDVNIKGIDLQLLKSQTNDLAGMDLSKLDEKTSDSIEGLLELLDHISDVIEGYDK